MNWYRDLYVGETFQKKKKQVRHLVESGQIMRGLYLLILRTDVQNNQLEILTQKEFQKQLDRLEPLMIVGIAFESKEANDILVQITEQVYQETGTADIRAYFLSHC